MAIIKNPLTLVKSGAAPTLDTLGEKIQNNLITYTNNNITEIGHYEFYQKNKLEEIIARNVVTIYSNCFDGCSKLTNVILPKLENAFEYSFARCNILETLDLPSLKGAANYMCVNCSSLKTFKGSMYSIPLGIFQGCGLLENIYLYRNDRNTICALDNINGLPASASHHITIHVPNDLITSYQTATNWSTLYNNGYISFVAIS